MLLGCAGALACAGFPFGRPAPTGSVRGHLASPRAGTTASDEPMLVFLEPLDRTEGRAKQETIPLLRPGDGSLAPAVLAVSAGQTIRFVNQTDIYHHIFSYSESNPFDLGVVRRDQTRSIDLPNPGVVRIYCTLHPAERAVVFVAPSPYFATFRPAGAYEIRDVPPGRYRVHAWSEHAGRTTSRAVTVRSGASVMAELAGHSAALE